VTVETRERSVKRREELRVEMEDYLNMIRVFERTPGVSVREKAKRVRK
jgi:hypothetical protein